MRALVVASLACRALVCTRTSTAVVAWQSLRTETLSNPLVQTLAGAECT